MRLRDTLESAASDTDHYVDKAIVAASSPEDKRDFTLAVTEDFQGDLEFIMQVELLPTFVYKQEQFVTLVGEFEHAGGFSDEMYEPRGRRTAAPALHGYEISMCEAFLLIANFIQTDNDD